MRHLFTEIQTKFNADTSDFKLLVENLYYGEIPSGSSYPCAVLYVISDNSADTFTEEINRIVLQVDVFNKSSSPASCHDALTAAKKFFCGQTFTPEGLGEVQFTRDRVQHPRRESKLWRGSVDLRAVVLNMEE